MTTGYIFLLLAVTAALFAYIFFYESGQPSTREAAQLNASLLQFNPERIDRIRIQDNDSKIVFHRENGLWLIDSPVADRADAKAVSMLLNVAALLPKDDTLPSKDNGFDAANSKLSLLLSGPGAPPEIFIGKEAAVEGRIYVRLANSDTVYVTRDILKKLALKKVDEYRDHRLTNVNPPQVKRIAIKTATGDIELEKKLDHWEFNKPIRTRADEEKVTDFIMRIIGAHIHQFIPEKEANASATGLAEPRGTITIESEDQAKPDVLQIGLPDANNQVYARLSTRDAVLLLSSTAAHALKLLPNDLRDRHLLPINLDIVDRITILPTGKPKIVLSRKLEDWTVNGLPVNPDEIKRFAQAIQQQEVAAFVTDVASDLPKFGLDQPTLKMTFSSVASENTAETEAGEHPVGSILFGATEGGNVYAMVEGEPFVVSVPKTFLDTIFTDPAQWRDLSIFKLKPTDIVSLRLEREGRPPIAFSRDSKGVWKGAGPGGDIVPDVLPPGVPIQSLCNTLSTLRAVRRTSSSTEGLGFEQPAITLTFSTADKKPYRLVIGSIAPGSMWNAMTTPENGAFILSRPDVEVMQANF